MEVAMVRTTRQAVILLMLATGFQIIGNAQTGVTVSFAARSFAAAGEPRAITTADFNRDGQPDFATANLQLGGTAGAGVAVFLNRGDGTFAAPTTIPTGAGAFELIAADLNRDGRPDLAVANADANTVTILLGSSVGFVNAFTWTTSASPRSIAAGDFTGDGRLDLAVAAFNCNCVDIGRGNGDGTFATINTFQVGVNPEDLMTADLNRDGTLDLFVGHVGATLAILFGRGTGEFVLVRHDPNGTRTRGLAQADFDGNGRVDGVLVGDNKFRIELDLPGNAVYGAALLADTRGVVAFDVNSDGWPDAAVANRGAGGVQVLVNTTPETGGISFRIPPFRFATGAGARAVTSADVDGDGRGDLIVANQSARTITVLRNQTARFPPTTDIR
jgi:hypothetical protein